MQWYVTELQPNGVFGPAAMVPELSSAARDVFPSLGATVNTAFSDQQPHIAGDRQTLYFASDRPGGLGLIDLYVTTRAKDKDQIVQARR